MAVEAASVPLAGRLGPAYLIRAGRLAARAQEDIRAASLPPEAAVMTSGSLLADRRLEYARAFHDAGEADAAISLLEQAVGLAPDWPEGHFLLGEWCASAGRRDDAVAAYARCLALDPADRLGAIIRLALLGAAPPPATLPPAYVAAVFDEYAPRFDTTLLQALDYRVPALLGAALTSSLDSDNRIGAVLDLGCGTGLAGERFRQHATWLEGVDLSHAMVREAERRGVYDMLHVEDILGFLGRAMRRYDLVLAADVLGYVGEAAPLFAAVAKVLAPGGRFAFSAEQGDGDGFVLTAGHRFAHGEAYLNVQAEAAGLSVESIEPIVCRFEAGAPVAGLLMVARSPIKRAAPIDRAKAPLGEQAGIEDGIVEALDAPRAGQ